jgi:ubiquitin-conjugating enzyme E2 Q
MASPINHNCSATTSPSFIVNPSEATATLAEQKKRSLPDDETATGSSTAAAVDTSVDNDDSDYSYDDEECSPFELYAKDPEFIPAEAVHLSLRAERETNSSKRRLLNDLYRIMKENKGAMGFSIEPVSEECMDKWSIKLFNIDVDSQLARDMLVAGVECLDLEMNFTDTYPFDPPAVRLVRPKIQGGFVIQGALCLELLTADGWNPTNDIESVIVSIRSMIVVGDGRLVATLNLSKSKYDEMLALATAVHNNTDALSDAEKSDAIATLRQKQEQLCANHLGSYNSSHAESSHEYLSKLHKERGWSDSFVRKG